MVSEPQKTPLYDMHEKYGGRLVDFAGWWLPVQYAGIIAEHNTVRTRAGLFDVSHMGEVRIAGRQGLDLLQRMVANDVAALATNQIQYTHLMYPNGGVVDDLLIYRLTDKEYYLVVNASNASKDLEWIRDVAVQFPDAQVIDLSAGTAELAIQGPNAAAIVGKLTKLDLAQMKYYSCRRGVRVSKATCIVSRTGYTGEDGFELFCLPNDAERLWEDLMTAGQELGLLPIGLGARDSLRFEASMPLYGHELDADTTPIEAGLARFVRINKPDFIGKDVLAKQLESGVSKTLVGFEMNDRGVPRTGYRLKADGKDIGHVTTGSYAPALDKNLGMGYVPPELSSPGTRLAVDIRGRDVAATIVPMPFYRRKRK